MSVISLLRFVLPERCNEKQETAISKQKVRERMDRLVVMVFSYR